MTTTNKTMKHGIITGLDVEYIYVWAEYLCFKELRFHRRNDIHFQVFIINFTNPMHIWIFPILTYEFSREKWYHSIKIKQMTKFKRPITYVIYCFQWFTNIYKLIVNEEAN